MLEEYLLLDDKKIKIKQLEALLLSGKLRPLESYWCYITIKKLKKEK